MFSYESVIHCYLDIKMLCGITVVNKRIALGERRPPQSMYPDNPDSDQDHFPNVITFSFLFPFRTIPENFIKMHQ